MARLPDLSHYATLADVADEMLPLYGERTLFVAETDEGKEEWSALDVRRRSRLAAYRMHAAGIQSGDAVLIKSVGGPAMAAFYLAAWRAGFVPVPLDQRFSADISARVREHSGARWGVFDAADEDESSANDPRRLILEELVDPRTDQLPADWEQQVAALPRPKRSDLLAIMYTSGTTGHPRGVMLSHANALEPMTVMFSKTSTRLLMQLMYRGESRSVSFMPMSHVFGMMTLLGSFLFGTQVAYPRGRTPRAMLQAMRDYRPTIIGGAPRILEIVWKQLMREIDASGGSAAFESKRERAGRYPYWMRRRMFKPELALLGGAVKSVGSGGAYLPPDLQADWESIGLPVTQGYGATECSTIAGTSMLRHPKGKVGKLSTVNRVELAPDGEIIVSGPGVSAGYWRDPEATAYSWDEQGRYHTGDIGQLDKQGNLILIGRKRNIIVLSNGLNVYPEDIEAALRDVGLGDTVVVETAPGRIEAVILNPESGMDAGRIDALVRAANARLTSHERVDAWRLWPDQDFPRTHTEKIRRDRVREWASTGTVPMPVREGLAEA